MDATFLTFSWAGGLILDELVWVSDTAICGTKRSDRRKGKTREMSDCQSGEEIMGHTET